MLRKLLSNGLPRLSCSYPTDAYQHHASRHKPSGTVHLTQQHLKSSSTHTANWNVQYKDISFDSNISKSTKVHFNVGYVDSASDVAESDVTESLPVILGLHGCPGTHRDIQPFLEPFADKGYRIILPNMPSFGITTFAHHQSPTFKKEALYCHSPQEQANFITQLLQDLQITKVQLVVGHSVGIIPPLVMCASSDLQIKGAAFVCAVHGHKPPRGMRPYWLVQKGGKWWYSDKIGSDFRRYLMVKLYQQGIAKRNKVKYSEAEEVGAIIQTGCNMGFDKLPSFAKTIADRKLPLLYVVTDSDPLISAEDSLEFAAMLGVGPTYIVRYDAHGKLLQDSIEQNGVTRGIRLASSSHIPHMEEAMASVIQREIENMLVKIGNQEECSDEKNVSCFS